MMRRSYADFLVSISSVAAILALWEVLAKSNIIAPMFFPPPTEILTRLIELLSPGSELPGHILASFRRFALGVLLGAPAAVLLGVLIGLNRTVALLFKYPLALTYPIPKIAVFPLLLIIFGIGDESKIVMVALGVFYLVLFDTVHGVQRLSSLEYFQIAAVYRIPFPVKLLRVVMRGILPDILQGIKMGLGYGLVMVVAAEFVLSRDGIGLVLWRGWEQFRIVDVYCGLVVLALAGVALFSLCDFLKGRLKGFSGDLPE